MKIVIIGAGISGCSLYLALQKHLPRPAPPAQDHEYIIYEAYDTPRNLPGRHAAGDTHSATLVVGGGLGIGPNGLKVLKRLDEDLFHDVVRAGYPYSCAKLMNSYGWTLMRMPTPGGAPQINAVAMSRHAIWNCLRDRIPDGIIVNKRVSAVVANPDGRNIIKFADDSPDIEADLVLGADGLKSTAKMALFPEAKEDPFPPHYEGVVGVGGFVPSTGLEEHIEPGTMGLVFGGNGFFGYVYTETSETAPNRHIPEGVAPAGRTVTWWSTYSIDECPDPKTIDKDAVLRDLRQRHGSWKNPVIQKIINKVEVDTMYPVWTTPELPTWERDGVVLIGDAAHALPPTSGQGTSQALEDVECFSMFLSYNLKQAYLAPQDTQVATEKAAIKQAAKQYMDLRQPRVKMILNWAKTMENKKRNLNIFEEWIMYLILLILGMLPTPSYVKKLSNYNMAAEVDRVITGTIS